jgi:hypothetical protein
VVRRTPAAIVSAPASAGVREPLRLRGIAIGTPARLPAAADVFAGVEGDTLRASRAPGATSGAPLSPVIWRMPVGSGQVIVSGAFDAWRYRDTAQSTFDATWRDLVDEAASAREPRLDLQPSRTLVTPRADLSVTLTARDTAALLGARLSLRRARSDSTWDTPQLIGSRVTGQTRLATIRAPLTPGVYELIAANGIDSARAPLHGCRSCFAMETMPPHWWARGRAPVGGRSLRRHACPSSTHSWRRRFVPPPSASSGIPCALRGGCFHLHWRWPANGGSAADAVSPEAHQPGQQPRPRPRPFRPMFSKGYHLRCHCFAGIIPVPAFLQFPATRACTHANRSKPSPIR